MKSKHPKRKPLRIPVLEALEAKLLLSAELGVAVDTSQAYGAFLIQRSLQARGLENQHGLRSDNGADLLSAVAGGVESLSMIHNRIERATPLRVLMPTGDQSAVETAGSGVREFPIAQNPPLRTGSGSAGANRNLDLSGLTDNGDAIAQPNQPGEEGGNSGSNGSGGTNGTNGVIDGGTVQAVQHGADLAVTNIQAIASTAYRGNLELTWTVTNIGDRPTDQPGWQDSAYFSTDRGLDVNAGEDVYLGSWWTGPYAPLGPGQSYTMTRYVPTPAGDVRQGYVILVSDRLNRQSEISERNNVVAASRTVRGGPTDPTGPTTNLGGTLGAGGVFTTEERDALLAGLDKLSTWANDLSVFDQIGRPITMLAQQVGQVTQSRTLGELLGSSGSDIGIGSIFRSVLSGPAVAYLSGAGPYTASGLGLALENKLETIGSVPYRVDTTGGRNELVYTLNLSTSATLANAKFNINKRVDTPQIAISASVDLAATGTLNGTFELGLDLDAIDPSQPVGAWLNQAFFVRQIGSNPLATIAATAQASGINLTVDVGFLEGKVQGGTASLSAVRNITLNNPDSDAFGRITLGELLGTPLTSLVGVARAGGPVYPDELTINLPLTGSFGAYSLQLGAASANVKIADNSVLDLTPPSVTGSNFNVDVDLFSAITSTDWNAVLSTLATGLTRLGGSSGLQTNLPFLGTTASVPSSKMADLLDFGAALRDRVLSFIEQPATVGETSTKVPKFSSVQGFTRLLTQALGVSESSLLPAYDTVSKRLTLKVVFEHTFVSTTLPLSVDLDLSPIGSFSSTGNLAVNARGKIEFTLGVDMAPMGSRFQTELLNAMPTGYSNFATVPLALLNGGSGVRGGEIDNKNDLRIISRSGATANVNLDGVTTIGGVRDAINSASAGIGVTASLTTNVLSAMNASTRFSIKLVDASVGDNVFRVEALNDSLALIDLGLVSPDDDGDGQIESLPLHGETWVSRLFIQNARLTGTVSAANSGNISGSFKIGFIGVQVGSVVASATASVSLQINNLSTEADPAQRVTYISDFTDKGIGAVVTPGLSGSGSLTISGVTVDGGFMSVTPGASITVSVPDLSNLSGVLVTPNTAAMNLFDLKAVGIDVALNALKSGITYLSTLSNMPALTTKLPLIDRSIMDLLNTTNTNDVVKFTDQILAVVNAVNAGSAGTAPLLDAALDSVLQSVLGPSFTNAANVTFDPATHVLDIVLTYDRRFNGTVPLEFSLADLGIGNLDGLVDAQVGGSLGYHARVNLTLDVAIGLADPSSPQVYIRDNSGFNVYGLIQSNNLELSLAAGPFAVYAGRPGDFGLLNLNRLGTTTMLPTGPTASTADWATFGVNLIDIPTPGSGQLPHLYPLSSLGTSAVDVTVMGAATATLPLYSRNPLSGVISKIPAPMAHPERVNLVLSTGSLTSPSLTISAPDLASIFTPPSLTDFTGLSEGLDGFLNRLDSLLSIGVLANKLPLVGDKLNDVTQVFTDLRDAIQQLRDAIETQTGLLSSQLQQMIYDLVKQDGAGPGLDLLKDTTGNGTVDINDVIAVISANGVDFDILLGQTLTFSQSIVFDLGLPSVGLGIDTGPNSAITLSASYSLRLGFGVTLADGFFMKTGAPGSAPEFSLNVSASLANFDATGSLAFLKVNITDNPAHPTALNATFAIDLKDPNSDGKLTLTEMRNAADIKTVLVPTLSGRADANLHIVTTVGTAQLPSISFDLVAGWGLNWNFSSGLIGSAPTLAFNNIQLDAGKFLSSVASPILDRINQITRPIRPLLDVLTMRLPVLSDLYDRDVDLLTLAEWFRPEISVAPARSFINAVKALADTLPGLISPANGSMMIPLGNFNISALGADLRSATTKLSNLNVDLRNAPSAADLKTALMNGPASSRFASGYRGLSGGGFSLPILESPSEVFSMLLGKDATFFKYTTPKLEAGFSYTRFFKIYGPLGARLTAGLDVTAQFTFGFDTFGVRQFFASNLSSSDPSKYALLAKGFFISDVDAQGRDVAEATLSGRLELSAELNLDLKIVQVSVGIGGGIYANVSLDLANNFQDGDGDFTKIRVASLVTRPLAAFVLSGEIYAEFFAYLNVTFTLDLGFYSETFTLFDYNWKIARIDIFKFSIGGDADGGANGEEIPDVANVAGNTLTLVMTDGNDEFLVERTGASAYKVTGNGTVEEFTGVTINNIVADGKKGDDAVVVQAVTGQTMAAAMDFTGGDGNDKLTYVGTGAVTASGGAGDDTLTGGAGIDTLLGEAGADTLVAGAGLNNTLRGGSDNDRLTGGIGADMMYGDDGDDSLEGGDGDDTLEGGLGKDTLKGGGGSDTLRGQEDKDTLDGGDGTDTVYGGSGNDALVGGAGNDQLFGEAGDDNMQGNDGNDLLDGGSENDRLTGGAGDDDLLGGVGNDSIDGGAGSDWIVGGDGADNLSGGAEVDFMWGDGVAGGATRGVFPVVSGASAPVLPGGVTAAGSTGAGDGNDTVDAGTDDATDWVFASGGNDTVLAQGGADYVDAGDGNDTVRAGAGKDRVVAGAGDDLVLGGRGDDIIFGQSGNDRLYGGLGSDVNKVDGSELDTGDDMISGGVGNDQVDGGDGADILTGDEDNDTIIGGVGGDTISGNDGSDMLYGGLMRAMEATPTSDGSGVVNTIVGGDGNDILFGDNTPDVMYGDGVNAAAPGTGNDTIRGFGGNDTIAGGRGADVVYGDAGNDTIYAGFTAVGGGDSAANTVRGDAGDDSIYGDSGADRLLGEDGNDIIDANAGDDSVEGGDGNDTVHGNAGADSIDGGKGDDTLYGDSENDVVYGSFGADSIVGGAGDDQLFGGVFGLGGADAQPNMISGESGLDGIFGDAGVDTISGGDDADRIYANGGNDAVHGDAGSDLISGGTGTDELYGDAGEDLIYTGRSQTGGGDGQANTADGGADKDTIFGDGGADTLRGAGGDDDIFGNDGNDLIEGGDGVDNLRGNAGNDEIYGGANADTIDGGTGVDAMVGGGDADRIVLDLSAPAGTEVLLGHGKNYKLDVADAPGNNSTDADILDISSPVGAGDDTLAIGRPSGSVSSTERNLEVIFNGVTIPVQWREADGTPRIEQFQINMGDGTNVVEFLSGVNNKLDLDYLARADVPGRLGVRNPSEMVAIVTGGTGRDLIIGSDGRDYLIGGEGDDYLFGMAGDDRLWGDVPNAGPTGATGAGGGGNDYLYTGLGNDDAFGQGGSDALFAAQRGNEAVLTSVGATRTALLAPNLAGIDMISSASALDKGYNRLHGGALSDTLYGGYGADFMYGGDGSTDNDVLLDRLNQPVTSESVATGWVDYAKTLDKVWYVAGTDAAETYEVKYVTSSTLGQIVNSVKIEVAIGASGLNLLFNLDFNAFVPDGLGTTPVWCDPLNPSASAGLNSYTSFVTNNNYDIIVIDAAGGDDTVTVSQQVRKSVWVAGGSGNDIVNLSVANQNGDRLVPTATPTTSDLLATINAVQSTALRTALNIGAGPGQISAATAAENWLTEITNRRDIVVDTSGNDVISGGPGEDWIFGGPGNDVLFGGLDAQLAGGVLQRVDRTDFIDAGAGNDTFQIIPQQTDINSPGVYDQFFGGPGLDQAFYDGNYSNGSGVNTPDFVMLGYDSTSVVGQAVYQVGALVRRADALTSTNGGAAAGATSTNAFVGTNSTTFQVRQSRFLPSAIESLVINTRGGDDFIYADAVPNITTTGSGGAVKPGGIDRTATAKGASIPNILVLGGDNNDTIVGSQLDDALYGGTGRDFIRGSTGSDVLSGDGDPNDPSTGADDYLMGDDSAAPAGIAAPPTIGSLISATANSDYLSYQLANVASNTTDSAMLSETFTAFRFPKPVTEIPNSSFNPTPGQAVPTISNSGNFLVGNGTPQTFDGTTPGLQTATYVDATTTERWFNFTTLGDGGADLISGGDRDRNFIRLTPDAYSRTIVAPATSGHALRNANGSTTVSTTNIRVVGDPAALRTGILEFDLSSLLGEPEDLTSATLTLKASWTSGAAETLRRLDVYVLPEEADFAVSGTYALGNASATGDLRTSANLVGSIPLSTQNGVNANLTFDLTNVVRNALDSGRTRVSLRLETPGTTVNVTDIQRPNRAQGTVSALTLIAQQTGVLADIYTSSGQLVTAARSVIDMRLLKAGKYFMRVYTPEVPVTGRTDFGFEITAPMAGFAQVSSFRDVIDGGPQNDTIVGGAGFDQLQGGPGTDTAAGELGVYVDGVANATEFGTDVETTVALGGADVNRVANDPLPVNPIVAIDSRLNGVQAEGPSTSPDITPDGRYLAYASFADNIVVDDSGGQDIFVFDRTTGFTSRITLGLNGTQPNGDSSAPSISDDGRYVVFASTASNLVAGDTNGKSDIFLVDRLLRTTTLVSTATTTTLPSNGISVAPTISGDGNVIAFESTATDIISSQNDTNNQTDVFIYDRTVPTAPVKSRISGGAGGGAGGGYDSSLSTTGQFVAFTSTAALVSEDTNSVADVYRWDRGVANPGYSSMVRVSVSKPLPQNGAGVQSNGPSDSASISGDGRSIVFASRGSLSFRVAGVGSDLVDSNGHEDVYFWLDMGPDTNPIAADRRYNGVTSLVSRTPVGNIPEILGGIPLTAAAQTNGGSGNPSISSDGLSVVYTTTASNITNVGVQIAQFPDFDNNGIADVIRVSRSFSGVPGEFNLLPDQGGGPKRMSLTAAGAQANATGAEPYFPVVSNGGTVVTFETNSPSLSGQNVTSIATNVSGVGATIPNNSTGLASELASVTRLDASFVGLTNLGDVRWLLSLRHATFAGNAIIDTATPPTPNLRALTGGVPKQTLIYDNSTLSTPAIQSLSLALNPSLDANLLVGTSTWRSLDIDGLNFAHGWTSGIRSNGVRLTLGDLSSNQTLGSLTSLSAAGTTGTGIRATLPFGIFSGLQTLDVTRSDKFDANIGTLPGIKTFVASALVEAGGSPNTAGQLAALSGALYARTPAVAVFTNEETRNLKLLATYATGFRPNGVTTGDFNQDGRMDFVTANDGGQGVSVFLANGSGGYAAAVNYSLGGGSSATDIKTADVNNDGRLDIIATSSSVFSSVFVLIGNANGTFGASISTSVGPGVSPRGLTTGLFNNDSSIDIAVTTDSGDLRLMLGNGNGSFGAPTIFAVGAGPVQAVSGDFNGDAKTDVAVAVSGSSGSVSVLLNNGAGSFSAPVSYAADPGAASVAVGDLNADGRLDLVIGANTKADVFLGNSNGTFQTAVKYTVSGNSINVGIGDINGDGNLDVVNTSQNTGIISPSYLPGTGTGTLQAPVSIPLAVASGTFVISDLNADGRVDMVLNNWMENTVSVLLSEFRTGETRNPRVNQVGLTGINGVIQPGQVITNSPAPRVLAQFDQPVFAQPTNSATFTPTTTVQAGLSPRSLTTGDFNQDGKPDVVSANVNSDDVSVILSNGLGGFSPPVNYSVGSGGALALAISTGDLNNDGRLDLAVATYWGGLVTLLGNADGTFQSAQPVFDGYSGRGVVTGNFNGDSNLDAAVTLDSSGQVQVFFGNGSGGFGLSSLFAVGTTPLGLNTGDFNGDGKADLAVANYGSTSISVLIGNGNGGFSGPASYAVPPTAGTVALGDLNTDGKLDIVVGFEFERNVAVLFGTGTGTFQAASTYATPGLFGGVSVGDINGDGLLDVVGASQDTNTFMYLLGTGTGSLQSPVSIRAGLGTFSVRLADFDVDGRMDVAVVNNDASTVSVYRNTTNRLFSTPTTLALSAGSDARTMVTGDFNRDGKIDFATANFASSNVSVFIGNGLGGFASAVNYAVATGPLAIATGDFNNDGRLDIVTLSSSSQVRFTVLPGNAAGTFDALVNTTVGPGAFAARGITVGDFNADGKLDAGFNYTGGQFSGWLGNGSGGFAAAFNAEAVGPNPFGVIYADFDRDGKGDVVTANAGANTVTMQRGASNGSFFGATSFTVGTAPSALDFGDFNADGKLDLVVSNAGSGNISLLIGNGVGGFAAAVNYSIGATSVGEIDVTDLNADGKPDVVIANTSGNAVTYLLGAGNGTLLLPVTMSAGVGTASVMAGDFNGDGRPDLAAINRTANTISVYMNAAGNDTPLQFRQSASGPTSGSPRAIATADFNKDGRPDVIVASYTAPGVQLYINQGAGSFAGPITISTAAAAFAIGTGDFDRDGNMDFAVAMTNGQVTTYRSGNPSTFNGFFGVSTATTTLGTLRSLDVADFNNDGRLDILVSGSTPSAIGILLGDGTGAFALPTSTMPVGTTPLMYRTVDANGDGKLDAVGVNYSSGTVSVVLGNGTGGFTSVSDTKAVGNNPNSIAVGDLNGDGKADFVASTEGTNLSVLISNGNGTLQFPSNIAVASGQTNGVSIADFNGDGRNDIAYTSSGTGTISILRGNGNGTFQTAISFAAGLTPFELAVADFDGDGLPDPATTNQLTPGFVTALLSSDLTRRNSSANAVGPRIRVVGPSGEVSGVTLSGFGTRELSVQFPSGLPSGVYSVSFEPGLTDDYRNPLNAPQTFTFTIDRAIPTGTLTSPVASLLNVAPAFIDIQWTDSLSGLNPASLGTDDLVITDASGVVPISGVPVLQGNGSYRYTLGRALVDGSVTVQTAANGISDLAGNFSVASALGSFTLDRSAPTAAISFPAPTAIIGTSLNYIDIIWSDLGVGINPATIGYADIFVSDSIGTVPVPFINPVLQPSGAYRYMFDRAFADGTVTVQTNGAGVVADLAGNASAFAILGSFTVDTTAVTGQVVSPAGNFNVDNGYVEVVWNVGGGTPLNLNSIDVGDVTVAQGSNQFPVYAVQAVVGQTNRYRYFYSGALAEGAVTITAVGNQVSDGAGNSVVTGVLATRILDRLSPVPALSPSGLIRPTIPTTIDVVFTDLLGINPGTIQSSDLQFSVPGLTAVGTPVLQAGGAYRFTLSYTTPPNTPVFPGGLVTVTMAAGVIADALGNLNPALTVGTFTVDKFGPIATLVSPTHGSNLASSVSTIRVLLTDPVGVGLATGSVQAADFSVDGAAITGIAPVVGTPGLYELTLASALPDGPGVVRVVGGISDNFGNLTAQGVVGTFLIDRSGPVGTLLPRTYSDFDDSPDTRYVDIRYTDAGSGVNFASAGVPDITIRNTTTNLPIVVTRANVLQDSVVRYYYSSLLQSLPNAVRPATSIITITRNVGRVADQLGNTNASAIELGSFVYRPNGAIIIRPDLVNPDNPINNGTQIGPRTHGVTTDSVGTLPQTFFTAGSENASGSEDSESGLASGANPVPVTFDVDADNWFIIDTIDSARDRGFFLATLDSSEHREIASTPDPDDTAFGFALLTELTPALGIQLPVLAG